jgi:hypothetical protein
MTRVRVGARLAPLLWGLLGTAAAAVPGFVVRGVDAAYRQDGAHLTPEIHALAIASGVLVFLSLGVSITLLVRRYHLLRPQGSGARVLYVGGLVSAHLVAVLGTLAGMIVVGINIFGPSYLGVRARAPDGHATAYLYSQALFCGYTIMTREPWGLLVRREHDVDMKCADKPTSPRLVWSADSRRVSVTDEHGTPVHSTTLDLWFGPH